MVINIISMCKNKFTYNSSGSILPLLSLSSIVNTFSDASYVSSYPAFIPFDKQTSINIAHNSSFSIWPSPSTKRNGEKEKRETMISALDDDSMFLFQGEKEGERVEKKNESYHQIVYTSL
jgi:hypothetical protein